MKKLLLIIFATLLPLLKIYGYDMEITTSYTSLSQTFSYNIVGDGEVELAKYSAYGKATYYLPDKITVPEEITYEEKTYKVVSLGAEAFKDNSFLWDIYLPYTIRKIGPGCFQGGKQLRKVTLTGEGSNSITSIGNSAFAGCVYFFDTNIIGDSLTTIGNSAFSGCIRLISARIPNSVTYLGNRAFYNCKELISASIGTGLRSIPTEAFYGCVNMKTLSIASGVQIIGNNAFEGAGISNVRIPESVTTIYNSAFANCKQLTSVVLPNSITSISERVFYGCVNLTEITIPASVKRIETSAFYGCTNLSKIDFADDSSLNEIAATAFSGTNISNITLPNSMKVIGQGCFQACNRLLSVTLGNSVSTIGDNAFANCNSLRQVFSYSVTPPNISFTTFSEPKYDTIVLKVPHGAVSAYSVHEVWGLFNNIVGVEGAGLEVVTNNEIKGIEKIYTISGIFVGESTAGLPKGIYIVRNGSTTRKIAI